MFENLQKFMRNWSGQVTGQNNETAAMKVQDPERKLELYQLEDRVLFSAAPIGDLVDAAHLETEVMPLSTFDDLFTAADDVPVTNDFFSEPSLVLNAEDLKPNGNELVFIDASVAEIDAILGDLNQQRADGEILDFVLLDSDGNGLQQITDVLDRYTNLDAVHVVSHGDSDAVKLGNYWLSSSGIDTHSELFRHWSASLATGADILLYGCDVAASADGQSLVDTLSDLTGADVAASIDATGAGDLSGDWELEYQTGTIEADIAFSWLVQQNWHQVLEVGGTGVINVDQAWLDAQGSGGPYYLSQAGATYVLQTDVTTEGTAFAIVAQDVTFDLNGHTINFDSDAPITVFNHSFEQGSGSSADGWDYSNAPNVERYEGVWIQNEVYDGLYSLKFNLPLSGGEEYVESTGTVQLEANTTYALSGMFQREGGGTGYVQLVSGNTVVHEVFYNGGNSRGIQFVEEVFTTGNSAETYTIRVGVRGASSGTDPFFIDDIMIERTDVHGIAVGPRSYKSNWFSDLTQFGDADRAVVTNGTIVQVNEATNSHGIISYLADDVVISNLNVTVQGTNSNNIFAHSSQRYLFDNNVLNNDVTTIVSRDNFDGAVIIVRVGGMEGVVSNNQLIGGVQNGFAMIGGAAEIHDNYISGNSKYTNGFAINLYGDKGSDVHHNVIDSGSGDNGSRGIYVGENLNNSGTYIHHNTITVQELARNQEYQGGSPGAYGIQLEDFSNAYVYENDVTVNAREVDAYAFRILRGDNYYVYDNTFRAVSFSSNYEAASLRFRTLDGTSNLVFQNNTLETNDVWFGKSKGLADLVFESTTFVHTDGDFNNHPLHTWNWELDGVASHIIDNLRFVDNIFADNLSEQVFDNASSTVWNHKEQVDQNSSYIHSFNTTFQVQDLGGQAIANANVVVEDSSGTQVFSGMTDVNGVVNVLLDEFQTFGSNNTDMSNYTYTVTTGTSQTSQSFVADQTQVLQIDVAQSFNYSPVVENPIGPVVVNEDAVNSVFDLSYVFSDVEHDASLVYSVTSNSNPALLDASTVGNNLVLNYLPNQNGSATVVVRATDPLGAMVEHTVNVTVNAINDAPTIASAIGSVSVQQDAPNSLFDLSQVFDDADILTNGDGLSYSLVANDNPSLVSTTINGDALTLSYAPGQTGSATLVIRATDQAGLFVDHNVDVLVTPMNYPPTVDSPIGNVAVNEDSSSSVFDLSTVFGDPNGDQLNYSIVVNDNPELVSTMVQGATLTLDYAPDQNGSATIVVRATDEHGQYVDDTINLSVAAINDAPTIVQPVGNVNVQQDAPNSLFDLSQVFGDSDIVTNGDNLSFSVVSNDNPSLVTGIVNGDALILSYAPGQSGSATVVVRATDSFGEFADHTIDVSVEPGNQAPTVVSAIGNVTANEDSLNSVFDLSTVFEDADGDPLTYSVVVNDNPQLVTADLQGSTLTLDYLPDQNGTASIVVRATDSAGNYVEDTINLTVVSVNDAPTVLDPISYYSVKKNDTSSTFDLSQVFGDVDIATNDDSLSYLLVSNDNPDSVAASIDGNVLTLDYLAHSGGSATIVIRATDENGEMVETSFVITFGKGNGGNGGNGKDKPHGKPN